MRRVFGLVLVAWFAAVACSINTQPSGTGSSADASAGGAAGGTGLDSGTGGATCFPSPNQKYCGGNLCPFTNDPAHGCADPACAPCALPNAINDCENGKCGIQSCNPGFDNCDSDPSNGCETNITSDPHNCGACGKDCFASGGSTNWVCNQGKCEVSNCPAGKGDCNNNSADGCEVNLTSDPKNCSFCGNDCSSAEQNATAVCTNSKCDYSTCNAGWADCDGNRANGCEKNVATDPTNCGACGKVCSSTNGAAGCVGGKCTIACKPGYADCSSTQPGCDTQITTTTNCGTCGNNCTTSVKNATPICDKGKCSYSGSCAAGWADCNGSKADGCETPLNTTSNCGACGANCNGVKNATAVCTNGACGYTGACNAGWGDCDNKANNGCEKDVSSDVNNCGACQYKCGDHVLNAGGLSCSQGTCDYSSCNNGYADCDGNRTNGCETDLKQPKTCGSCTNDCTTQVLNVSVSNITCGANGSCGYTGSCNAGYGDCSGGPADGCETALNTDAHCGDCKTTCNGQKHCQCSSPGSCACL